MNVENKEELMCDMCLFKRTKRKFEAQAVYGNADNQEEGNMID